MRSTFLSALPLLIGASLIGCDDKDDGEGDDGTDVDTSDGDGDSADPGGDDTGPPADVHGTISGSVQVQLYSLDGNGDKVEISFEETYGEGAAFPFGKIFVAAYYEDEDGKQRYVGEDVIEAPTTGANEYNINAEMAGSHEVFVYAVLDYYPVDNIIGTQEPKGVYPKGIDFVDGTAADKADISILAAPYGGGGGGGGGCDVATISGDVILTSSYAGGDVAVMLLSAAGEGPYYSTRVTPENSGGGASSPYALAPCAGTGSSQLKGAWDKNGNGMFDPMDKWGAYISSPDVNGNPILVESVDLVGYDIQIPLGGEEGLKLVPFVRLSGTLNAGATPLSDLTGAVYVAALKYRPTADVSVETLEGGYDLDTFTKLTGSSVEWQLIVPAESIIYLWAYNDADSDGVVNEVGEYVGSGNAGDGRYPTGSSSESDIVISMGNPSAE